MPEESIIVVPSTSSVNFIVWVSPILVLAAARIAVTSWISVVDIGSSDVSSSPHAARQDNTIKHVSILTNVGFNELHLFLIDVTFLRGERASSAKNIA